MRSSGGESTSLLRPINVRHDDLRDPPNPILRLRKRPLNRIREKRNHNRPRPREHNPHIVRQHRRKITGLVADWNAQVMRHPPRPSLLRAQHSDHVGARLLRRDRRRRRIPIAAPLNGLEHHPVARGVIALSQ
jgi:hypothetical protein